MKAKLHLNITNTQLCFAFEEEIILGRREEGEVSGEVERRIYGGGMFVPKKRASGKFGREER